MTNSIYNKLDTEKIVARIQSLSPNAKALWGKMTADQMLQHCNAAVEVAFGEKEVSVNWMMRILGKLIKKKIFNTTFQHNSPTAPEFVFNEMSEKVIICDKNIDCLISSGLVDAFYNVLTTNIFEKKDKQIFPLFCLDQKLRKF